jgi:hypothetical protein
MVWCESLGVKESRRANPLPFFTACASFSDPYIRLQGGGTGLAAPCSEFVCGAGGFMSKGQWLLVGAVALGLAVGLYILFFCPTECH